MLSVYSIWKIFSCIDVQTETVSSTSLCQSTLDGFVDVGTPDLFKGDGLVSGIHYRQILDVLQSFDGDRHLDPTGPSVCKVVPAIWRLIDGVGCFWEMGLDELPCPCPREIGQTALLLHMLIAIDSVEQRKY